MALCAPQLQHRLHHPHCRSQRYPPGSWLLAFMSKLAASLLSERLCVIETRQSCEITTAFNRSSMYTPCIPATLAQLQATYCLELELHSESYQTLQSIFPWRHLGGRRKSAASSLRWIPASVSPECTSSLPPLLLSMRDVLPRRQCTH